MEALTAEMQANIHKRSSERLRMYLIKAGRDEDEVMTWDRNTLMEEWALEIGKKEEEFKASPASPEETAYELQKRRLEFEIRKYEEQEERGRKERTEGEGRKRKEGTEGEGRKGGKEERGRKERTEGEGRKRKEGKEGEGRKGGKEERGRKERTEGEGRKRKDGTEGEG